METGKRILRIESKIQGASILERMKYYKVPGLSIAVIDDGSLEWAKAYGTIDSRTGAPFTTESFCEAASITKLLVAVAALHFVDTGSMNLDTDLNIYLKSWKIPDHVSGKGEKVTLRMILSHRSGLPMANLLFAQGSTPTLLDVLHGRSPASNDAVRPSTLPGTEWEYSNSGFAVLQQVLEDLSGKPLSQLMEELIFKPLKMNSSTLSYPLPAASQKNEALPHDEKGKLGKPYMHPAALAHGGLMSTPSDMARFAIELIKAQTGKSNKLLSGRTAQKMLNKESDIDPRKMDGLKFSQGLGGFLSGSGNNLYFSHTGGNYPGAISLMTYLPYLGKGVIIMTNGAGAIPLIRELMTALEKEYALPLFFE